jgi:class 3 adenylate cyclase
MNGLGVSAAIVAAIVVGVIAYLIGRNRPRPTTTASHGLERRLEEYDFYPFTVDAKGHVQFDTEAFNAAVTALLDEHNPRAARELIIIGEQNLVRDTFPSDWLQNYLHLYAAYDGDAIVSDNDLYLENYMRIVHQLGRSFPNTGIEILLHNLVNPSRSLVAIENGEVTGRQIGSGATNLVLDLKTRRQRGEDKVNYELNIGSRQFKCTTVPIFRPEYGLVGALCINIDTHFIRDAAATGGDRLDAFIDNLLRTDFTLDENILSKAEFHNAERGKRHFLDEQIRSTSHRAQERKLAAILFSDIVGFTSLMGDNETATLQIIRANESIHAEAIARHAGTLLKKLGDGMLASFDSVSNAVACAMEIRQAVATDGRFEVRIGIHLGEVVLADGDVHGDGVNIASRIQSEVGAGEIGVSRVVYENIRNKDGLTATLLGERTLKNVSIPVILYTLDTADPPS